MDGGRRCDQKELWYVMDGYEFPHWTESWVPVEAGGVRFTVVVYQKGGVPGVSEGLPMPPGLTAIAISIPCDAGHLTVGCTWDKEFAAEFLAKLRKQKRFDVAAVAAAGSGVSFGNFPKLKSARSGSASPTQLSSRVFTANSATAPGFSSTALVPCWGPT